MVFEVPSSKSLEQIDALLHESAGRHRFGITAVHDLKETMKKKGVDFSMDCMIYEVCNPHQAKKVLEANGAVSTALPCRISVYGGQGRYKLATIRPTAMMKMFGDAALDPVAHEVEEVIVKMMQESA